MKGFNSFMRGAAVLLVVAAAAACSKVKVTVTVAEAPGAELVVKVYDVNHLEVLDTLKADASGTCSYKTDIAAGDPMFHYVYYGGKRIASLLLQKGEKVSVIADTLGNYSVSGSEESDKLRQVEQNYNAFSAQMDELSRKLVSSSENDYDVRKALTDTYISYYRNSIRYVMENSHSLTVVPVFYQRLASGLPVFSQASDAIIFNNICDSLALSYPESKYVRSLRADAQRRLNNFSLESQLDQAGEVGYFDIELPDINSRNVKLSEVQAKVKMIHFWNPADPAQKMFNQDVLIPVYNDYHSRGFEIYCVALDADKAEWAAAVQNQGLAWINVCDVQAQYSKYVSLYNVTSLPVSYIICDETLDASGVNDEASLRRLLDKHLK